MKLTLNLIDDKSDLLGLYFLERLNLRFQAHLSIVGEPIASGRAWLRNESERLAVRLEIPVGEKPKPDLSSAVFTRTWPEERWIARSPGLKMSGTLDDGTEVELDLEVEQHIAKLNCTIFNFQVVALKEVFILGVAIRQRASSTVGIGVGTGSPLTNL